jgi:hypothetical protein
MISVWNYDCNPVGKLQESRMKDTSKICVHTETDKNGNPIRIKEEYTQGERLFSKRLRKISKFNKDNQLIEQITTTLDGKEQMHVCRDYNAAGNITETRQYIPNTKNLKMKYVFTYDTSGNLTEMVTYRKSDTTGTVMKYVYN